MQRDNKHIILIFGTTHLTTLRIHAVYLPITRFLSVNEVCKIANNETEKRVLILGTVKQP
jgi:hypothetical protein